MSWDEGPCLMVLVYLMEREGSPPGTAPSSACCLSEYHSLSQVAVEGGLPSSPAFMFYLKCRLAQRVLLSHWMWSVSASPFPLFSFFFSWSHSPPSVCAMCLIIWVCAEGACVSVLQQFNLNKVSVKMRNPWRGSLMRIKPQIEQHFRCITAPIINFSLTRGTNPPAGT